MSTTLKGLCPRVVSTGINWTGYGVAVPRSWQTMLQNVVGFRIRISHVCHTSSIEPLLQDQSIDLETNRSTHVFLLRPSEVITRIEGNVSINGDLQGIRFTTTDQISQWFGQYDGKTCTFENHDPSYYIHSFLQKYEDKKYRLSAIMYPRENFAMEVPPVLNAWKKMDILAPANSDQTPNFIKMSPHMFALKLQCPSAVSSIDVVSQQDYMNYIAMAEHFEYEDNACWFELLDEKLMTVEVGIENGIVTGIRLMTATRTTPWFGKKSEEKVALTVQENQRICGFYGYEEGGRIKSLGVMCLDV